MLSALVHRVCHVVMDNLGNVILKKIMMDAFKEPRTLRATESGAVLWLVIAEARRHVIFYKVPRTHTKAKFVP